MGSVSAGDGGSVVNGEHRTIPANPAILVPAYVGAARHTRLVAVNLSELFLGAFGGIKSTFRRRVEPAFQAALAGDFEPGYSLLDEAEALAGLVSDMLEELTGQRRDDAGTNTAIFDLADIGDLSDLLETIGTRSLANQERIRAELVAGGFYSQEEADAERAQEERDRPADVAEIIARRSVAVG